MKKLEPKNILLLTSDTIGPKMAGPGIRAINFAAEMQKKGHSVKVISSSDVHPINDLEIYSVKRKNKKEFSEFHSWADFIIFQGLAFEEFPELRKSTKILIADAYAPVVPETLARLKKSLFRISRRQFRDAQRIQREQILRSDYVLCANQRQKDFYLGAFLSLIQPTKKNLFDLNQANNKFIIVPFGLDSLQPIHCEQVIKGVIPGIKEKDKVVIWSGGLYEWFDTRTLIEAFNLIAKNNSDIKLFFLGAQNPNLDSQISKLISQTIKFAEEKNLLNKTVFFNQNWTDFDQRQNYLLESDLGVTTQYDAVETYFSFRTRMLDYIWAELPVVSSEGDYFSQLIIQEKLGKVVPYQNPDRLAEAIVSMLRDEKMYQKAKSNLSLLRSEYTWSKTLKPLVSLFALEKPVAGERPSNKAIRLSMLGPFRFTGKVNSIINSSLDILDEGGIKELTQRIWNWLAKK